MWICIFHQVIHIVTSRTIYVTYITSCKNLPSGVKNVGWQLTVRKRLLYNILLSDNYQNTALTHEFGQLASTGLAENVLTIICNQLINLLKFASYTICLDVVA